MLARIVAIAIVGAGCGGGADTPDAAPETSPFIGTWRVTMVDGMPPTGVTAWTFGPSEVAISSGFSGIYTFDSRETPKRIAVSIAGATPSPNLAIYRFDSDTAFTIKLQDGAPARATAFDVEPGYDVLVMAKQ